MSFDWDKFREIAEELKQRDDEASRRTAISRIYYAVYWKARVQMENDGFLFSEREGSHQQVWRAYFVKGGHTRQGIYRNGLLLRDARVKADYESEIEDLTNLVNDAFHRAKNIIVWLEQVQ